MADADWSRSLLAGGPCWPGRLGWLAAFAGPVATVGPATSVGLVAFVGPVAAVGWRPSLARSPQRSGCLRWPGGLVVAVGRQLSLARWPRLAPAASVGPSSLGWPRSRRAGRVSDVDPPSVPSCIIIITQVSFTPVLPFSAIFCRLKVGYRITFLPALFFIQSAPYVLGLFCI